MDYLELVAQVTSYIPDNSKKIWYAITAGEYIPNKDVGFPIRRPLASRDCAIYIGSPIR
jgi:hypothetical protein